MFNEYDDMVTIEELCITMGCYGMDIFFNSS